MIKAVLDTNVILSAHISRKGNCADIIRSIADFAFTPCFTQDILEEINRAIRYSKISKIHPGANEEIEAFIRFLFDFSLITKGDTILEAEIDDPDDIIILVCAVEAEADFIVSGDKHLLSLKEYNGIPIVKPAEFLLVLKKDTEIWSMEK